MYINLLDLYFDIDPVGFQKNIVKPLLESYVEYYEKFYFHSDVISSEAVNLRLTITYCNRVLVGFIDNKKDQTRENLAQVRKSVDSPAGMLTEDHHHTVHEESQVCYSSHLRPKSLHL